MTKRAFAPAAASHETGGIVSIDEWPVLPDVADKDALLQTLLDLDPTKVQRGVGYCPGRGHLGVGIYGACNLMLGRTWGV